MSDYRVLESHLRYHLACSPNLGPLQWSGHTSQQLRGLDQSQSELLAALLQQVS